MEEDNSNEASHYWDHPLYYDIVDTYDHLDVVYGIDNLNEGSVVMVNDWTYSDPAFVFNGRTMLQWMIHGNFRMFLLFMGRREEQHAYQPIFLFLYGEGIFPSIIDDLPNVTMITTPSAPSRLIVRTSRLSSILSQYNTALFYEYATSQGYSDPNVSIVEEDPN
jgi:hypothetical protein